jgi:hypothetical protein
MASAPKVLLTAISVTDAKSRPAALVAAKSRARTSFKPGCTVSLMMKRPLMAKLAGSDKDW